MNIQHIASKIKIAVFIVASLLGIYAALGFYVLPTLVKSKLPAPVQQETGRKAVVSTVHFDPFLLQLSLQGFKLQDPDGQLFVGFDDFFIDINVLQSLVQAMPVVDNVLLSKPVVRIAKHPDGSFNFKGLLKDKSETKQHDGKVFPINIVKLSITEGQLDWEDAHLKNPEKETVYPINLNIENFTTQADKTSRLSLTLALNSGGKLDWQGNISIDPLSSTGHVKLDNVQLPRIWALALQEFMPLDLLGYELFEADYKADYVDNKLNFNLNQGRFELREFQISTTQDEAPVKMPKFTASGIDFNLENHQLIIGSLAANDADFKLELTAEGAFNYQDFLPVSKAKADPVEPDKESWNIKINTVAFNNFGLSFKDQTLKKPLTITAKPVNFRLDNFDNKTGASLPFQFSALVNGTGSIKLNGNTIIKPLSAKMAVEVNDVALENFQAYFDKFAKLDVIDGKLAVDGKILPASSCSQLHTRALNCRQQRGVLHFPREIPVGIRASSSNRGRHVAHPFKH